jgi:hypothetical protein
MLRFKRNQVDGAIFPTLGADDARLGELQQRLKRLLVTDRRLGRRKSSKNPMGGRYAFYSQDAPGSGVEVMFSEYEAFALLAGLMFEHEQIVTKAAAGIEKLVTQFAAGDRHARRDLVAMAEKLGLDLTAGQHGAIEKAVTAALAAEDEAIINDFLRRHGVKPEQSAVTTDASSDQTKEAHQTSKES